MAPPTDQPAKAGESDYESRGAETPSEARAPTTSQSNEPPVKMETTKQPVSQPNRASENSLVLRSPIQSRETSPMRPQPRTTMSTPAQKSRSRKNSQEFSPTRSATLNGSFPSVPSAAAVQRALSANKPPLHPASVDGILESSRTDKLTKSGETSPHWPLSPRLRSPPPSTSTGRSSIPTLRKAESDVTSSSKRLATPSATDLTVSNQQNDTERDDPYSRSASRPVPRGAIVNGPGLETVAEGSAPTTPAAGPLLNMSGEHMLESQVDDKEQPGLDNGQQHGKENAGSGGDVVGPRGNAEKTDPSTKASTAALIRPTSISTKRSYSSLAPPKNKLPSDSLRSMTVETETVTSVPQIALGVNGERGASGRLNSVGSVRPKPSSETIRPKKEKKKATRKTPSLHSGTVSSKADIFEAKVASAIDETNSSDSDETFVYESNPPERNSRHAHHSRTPSATSLASQADQYGVRGKLNARDASQGVAAKKSMKFTNSAYNNNLDGETGNQGSTRSSIRNGSTTPRHHHIGRYGRGGHASLFDNDSPFTQASKSSSPRASSTKLSKPGSPRVISGRISNSPRKSDLYAYDLGDDDGADDERTPLVGSVRINRSRHARRPFSSSNRNVENDDYQERSPCSRYGACIIVTLLLLVLCIGAGTFVMALNKPLVDVSVKHIQNVLASEQEIMLDLDVRATNPNLFAISVNEIDVYVFAKSGYVGTAAFWRDKLSSRSSSWISRRRQFPSTGAIHVSKGVDEGTDPIDDPEGDPQTMLLGRIYDLDSPLVFEPSPVRRKPTSSVGQIRLAKPGNQTEVDGSARWERVLQHPFELIVRGVIKYQLPISSRTRSVSLGSRIKVLPKEELEGNDTARDV